VAIVPQLTREQKLEYLALRQEQDRRRALADPVYFIQNHGWIKHPEDDTGSIFKLWDVQKRALKLIVENDSTIFLKARRLGLTWLALNYAYWLMITAIGCRIGFIAQGGKEANSGVARIKWLHQKVSENSPHIVRHLDKSDVKNVETVNVGRSLFEAKPSTGGAFRGEAYRYVIVDEMAYCPNAKEIHSSVEPAIEGGGQSTYISTYNEKKVGLFFADLWQRSETGEAAAIKPFFASWMERPDRDAEWEARQRAKLTDPVFRREYPATVKDAFTADTRGSVYDLEQLEAAEKTGRYNPSTPLTVGIDWGTNTHFVYVQLVGAADTKSTAASYHIASELAIYQADKANISISDIVANNNKQTLKLSTGSIGYNYDAAGKQQAVTFAAATHQKLLPIPFNKYKNLTIGFIKYLLAEERLTIDNEACPVLYRQLKNQH